MLFSEMMPAVESNPLPSSALSQNRVIPGETDALVEGLPAGEVHKRALAARRKLGRAQRSLCFWLQEVEKRRLFREFGCSSTYHYAEIYLQLSPHTISEFLRISRELERFPLFAQALSEGKISTSKVKEVSRVAIEETEKLWLDAALKFTQREIEKMVAFTPRGGLPFGGNKGSKVGETPNVAGARKVGDAQSGKMEDDGQVTIPRIVPEDRSINVEEKKIEDITPDADAGLRKGIKYNDKLIIELSGEDMAVVKDAFDKARRDSGLKDRASLLAFISRAFLQGSSENTGKSSRPPYQIVLHRHSTSGLTWCESINGERYIDSSTLEKAICDAEIIDLREERDPADDTMKTDALPQISDEMMEEDQKNVPMGRSETFSKENCPHEILRSERGETPVSGENRSGKNPTMAFINDLYAQYKNKEKSGCKRHSRKKRISEFLSMHTIPRALRRKILLRDQCTCQNPGCGSRLYIVIHHIIPVGAGGENVEQNLLVLCHRCHELVHLGKLSVSGLAPHNLVWRNARGEILNY